MQNPHLGGYFVKHLLQVSRYTSKAASKQGKKFSKSVTSSRLSVTNIPIADRHLA